MRQYDKLLDRPVRQEDIPTLFEPELDWRNYWWDMPAFHQRDATPFRRLSVQFMTAEDVVEFAKTIGQRITDHTDSIWYPPQRVLRGEFSYVGEKATSRYPVCIPSKGRYNVQTTGKVLDRLGVVYRFFVEETEYDLYCRALGSKKVVSMPFHDLGKGSIPARNFIWKWAKKRGFKRHWVVDDNITSFARLNANRRLCVYGGGFFQAMEDFVDRYENIAMAGPHHKGFVKDRSRAIAPVLFNSRVYSCILLDTSLPFRWRGRYNEDTDLSLRVLKAGFCTVLFQALLMDKWTTVGVRNARPMKGGNTDNVYNTGDSRLAFARSLQRQHPDVVKVVWKFNRWHHQVDYSRFKKNKPRLKPGVVPKLGTNEYGMRLERTR